MSKKRGVLNTPLF